jgi:tetratricopeptide (TPR) repeat protein
LACLEGLRAALAGFEQVEDRRNACIARGNLGFILAELGELEGAEEALRAALVTADRMGLHDAAAVTRHNLGHVLSRRGRSEEARRLLRQSIETFERQRAPRSEGLTRVYLAQAELRAGDPAAAELEARAAADLLLAIPSAHAVAVAVLARALLGQGRSAEALEAAFTGYAELCDLGSIEEGEALVRLVYAEALDAAGRRDDCTAALVEARVRLLVRASRIRDPAWRERFLSNVHDNARTLELWRARIGC